MPRLYHSPSSIGLGLRCQRQWAYEYIDGLRPPRVTWQDILDGKPHKPRDRSTALGGATHDALENWYSPPSAVDWGSLPGQIALSGAHHLPHPSKCIEVIPEGGIGDVPLPDDRPEHAPPCALRVHGVLVAGWRDLLAKPLPEERARLKWPAPWMLVDYKTSSNIAQWSKTADELRHDTQANVYAVDAMRELGLRGEAPADRVVHARWLYLESKKVRRSLPVDFQINVDDALERLEEPLALMRELDTLERSQDAPQNHRACSAYGGCPHHVSEGGPCDARRSYATTKRRAQPKGEKPPMPIAKKPLSQDEMQAKFDAMKAAQEAKEAATAENAETAEDDAAPEEVVPQATPEPEPETRVAKKAPKKAPKKTAKKTAAPPTDSSVIVPPVKVLADAHNALTLAQAEVELAVAKRSDAISHLREALDLLDASI